jgi:hypothetical protein
VHFHDWRTARDRKAAVAANPASSQSQTAAA